MGKGTNKKNMRPAVKNRGTEDGRDSDSNGRRVEGKMREVEYGNGRKERMQPVD